jgi:micrococcal nuclease
MDETEHQPHTHRRRKRRLRLTGIITGLTTLALVFVARTAPDQLRAITPEPVQEAIEQTTGAVEQAQPGLAHVTRDVDGDTIDVTINGQKETVRFLGLDTPETHDPRKPVQCFGEVAAAHTKALLEGKNVRLEPDPQDSDKDKYGRLLRYIYLPDGTLVNAELIHDGYAFAYTVFPITKLDDFRALEADARQNNRGLWAGCNVDSSKDIKQTTSSK